MRGHRDLQIVAGLSLLCAGAALLAPFEWLSLAFAAPLALWLPGYSITAATFARRQLVWPQFLLLSLALSLATLALGSLVLHYAPGGIRAISWALLLLLVVLNGCRAAALRRKGSRAPQWPRLRMGRLEAGLLLGGIAAAVAALILSSATVPVDKALGYTQLWILPQARSGGSEVQIGVRSQEQNPMAFDLRVALGERRIVRRSFELDPGETRVIRLGAPAGAAAGSSTPVVATLLRHDRPHRVYRRVKGELVVPKGFQ